MSITAASLYRDTGNFFRHQLVTIILMALLTAFISFLISRSIMPDADQLTILNDSDAGNATSLMEMVQSLSPEQQQILLRFSAAGTFSALIGNVLLLGGMLSLIPMVSAGQRVSALRAIGASVSKLPGLLLLVFLITLIVQLGFMVIVVPGVLLAITLALAPVLYCNEKIGIFSAIRHGASLAWQNIRLVAPAVLLWLVTKLAILFLLPSTAMQPDNLAMVVTNGVGNLISAALIIYLSRLHMLLR